MSGLDLAVIGNCSFAALVDSRARIVWACMPGFDDDPVFCRLLDDGLTAGFYEVELDGCTQAEQAYRKNSAILVTTLRNEAGDAIEIVDFAPRFKQFDRLFRPVSIVRRIRPIAGHPRICVRLRPAHDYGAVRPHTTRGSNHIRYVTPGIVLRLSTDLPVSFILEEVPFVLDRPVNLILGADESLNRPIAETARDFAEKTHAYWRDWSRYLAVPFEWQEAVIRAAITLKLSAYEESGAIIAAVTTSIPEAPGSGRNWDYRFCWLRDAYFVVQALNRLGVTRTMEDFLGYILNVVATAEDGRLQPVYGILMQSELTEREVPTLRGYRGSGPVRVGNDAFRQVQHDVYGSVILAITQAFFDERLDLHGDVGLFRRLERLGENAFALHDQPDAGLWELRGTTSVHTFSALMCWAACDRLARIARQLHLEERVEHWRACADAIRDTIDRRAWNASLGTFVATFEGASLDASLLLMHHLDYLKADDPRFAATVEAVEKHLRRGDHMFRYTVADDFGYPEMAFNICTFWYIDALAALGRIDEARRLFEGMLASRNHVGLLSEDLDPATGELWGNFPQTYPLVGLINSAMGLSRSWEEAF